MMSKSVVICTSNGVNMKQDKIENAVKRITSSFLEEQCWEDVCSDKGCMGIDSSWVDTCAPFGSEMITLGMSYSYH
eukprot:14294416-Ditylum_brightwellii.AAC.1